MDPDPKDNPKDAKEVKSAWLNLEVKGVLLFAVIGVIMGYVSFLLVSPLRSLILAIAILVGSILVIRRFWKIKEKGYWSNKIVVYIFVWIIVWTIFYNMNISWGP
jgi:hypothetical protein